jgi:hypothetical protein
MKWPEDSDDRAKYVAVCWLLFLALSAVTLMLIYAPGFFCITVTVIFVIIMTIFSIGVLSE